MQKYSTWRSEMEPNEGYEGGPVEVYIATDVDARIAELENALNLIRDGNADDECASPLTKEDMQQIATNVLMDRS